MELREVAIIGVGMTKFKKHPDKSIKDLSRIACWNAFKDANVSPREIESVYCGNSLAGLLQNQECIRGQVVMKEVGIAGVPILNVENACATSTCALQAARIAVGSGLYNIALAVGFEKMYVGDTAKTTQAIATASDVDTEGGMGIFFPGIYAMQVKRYMSEYGLTREQIAKVSVKNHKNGCLNPHAQYQKEVTLEEVLNSPMIADPITLLMCAPIGDGAAAAVLCSKDLAKRYSEKPIITIAASTLKSSSIMNINIDDERPTAAERATKEAYEQAGVGPEDVDVAEVHDAFSPGEIYAYEELDFCKKGEGGRMIDEGKTEINGEIPVNTSGGLGCKGHPIAATGLGMIAEIVWQLRGEAGKRQVENAKVGLTQNGGGWFGGDAASMTVTILKR